MSLFESYEGNSPLHRRNPVMKLAALLFIAAVVTPDLKPSTPWLDPGAPLVFLALIILSLSLFGRIPLGAILRRVLALGLLALPLLLVRAATFDVTQAGVTSPAPLPGPWPLTREGLTDGLGLVLRLLTYAACAMAFIMTTDPADFALSLIQQVRLPARLGYRLLAATRFLPLLPGELDTLRAARHIRGLDDSGGPTRHLGALLAAARRNARRASIAMDGRGFEGRLERTHHRQTPVTAFDLSFLMTIIGLALVLVEVLIFAGLIDSIF